MYENVDFVGVPRSVTCVLLRVRATSLVPSREHFFY